MLYYLAYIDVPFLKIWNLRIEFLGKKPDYDLLFDPSVYDHVNDIKREGRLLGNMDS